MINELIILKQQKNILLFLQFKIGQLKNITAAKIRLTTKIAGEENYMSWVQNQEIILLHSITLLFNLNPHNSPRMSIMLKEQWPAWKDLMKLMIMIMMAHSFLYQRLKTLSIKATEPFENWNWLSYLPHYNFFLHEKTYKVPYFINSQRMQGTVQTNPPKEIKED